MCNATLIVIRTSSARLRWMQSEHGLNARASLGALTARGEAGRAELVPPCSNLRSLKLNGHKTLLRLARFAEGGRARASLHQPRAQGFDAFAL